MDYDEQVEKNIESDKEYCNKEEKDVSQQPSSVKKALCKVTVS